MDQNEKERIARAAASEMQPPVNSEDSGNPDGQTRRERYAEHEYAGGKATSPERDTMYDELDGVDSVGESGTQGSLLGREDQNPIAGNRRN